MSEEKLYTNMNRFELRKVIAEKFNLIEGYSQKSKDFYLSLLDGRKKVPKPLKKQLIKQVAEKYNISEAEVKDTKYEALEKALTSKKKLTERQVSERVITGTKEKKENKWDLIKKLETLYNWKADKPKRNYNSYELTDILDTFQNKTVEKVNITVNFILYEIEDEDMPKIDVPSKTFYYTERKFNINKRSNGKYDDIIKTIVKASIDNKSSQGYPVDVLKGSINYTIFKGDTNALIKSVRMKQANFEYKSLGIQKLTVDKNEGVCVIDGLLYALQGEERFKTLSKTKLIEQFQEFDKDILTEGISTHILCEWAKKYSPRLSVYAIDPMNKLFHKQQPEKAEKSFVYKLNGNHCYVITDEDEKNNVIRSTLHKLGETSFQPSFTVDNYNTLDIKGMEMTEILEKINIENPEKPNLIISGTISLNKMAVELTKSSEYYIEHLNFNEGFLSGFINPVNNLRIILNNNIEECFNICEKLYDKTKNPEHVFKGQSLPTLSNLWFTEVYGKLISSVYNENVLYTMNKFCAMPLVEEKKEEFKMNISDTFGQITEDDNILSLDVCKSYSSVLINNDIPYSVYSVFDEWKEYDKNEKIVIDGNMYPFVGDYIIPKPIKIKGIPTELNRVKYHAIIVKFLIENKYITHDDIKYHLKPSSTYKPDHFKQFTEEIYNTFDMSTAKLMINSFTGMTGKKYSKTMKGCMSDSFEVVSAMYNEITNKELTKDKIRNVAENQDNNQENNEEEEEINADKSEGVKIDIENLNGIYYLKESRKTRLIQDNLAIYNHIIFGGIVNALELCKQINEEGGKIEYIHTDAVGFKSMKPLDEINIKTTTNPLDFGKYRVIPYKKHGFTKVIRDIPENFNPMTVEIKKNNNYLITGHGGTGKTQKLVEMYEKDIEKGINCICVTPTAISRDTLIQRGIKIAKDLDETFLQDVSRNVWFELVRNLDKIYIDEIFMNGSKWISFFMQCCRMFPKLQIYAFGDFRQCDPVEKGRNTYNYINNNAFMSFFSNRIDLEYIEETSRYDKELKEVIHYFDENGIIQVNEQSLKNDLNEFDTFICKSNTTKKQIDKLMMDKINKSSTGVKVFIPYKGNEIQKQDVTLSKGMRVVCRKNNTDNSKNVKVSNSSFFDIVDISSEEIELKFVHFPEKENVKISVNKFHDNFELGYCNTIYRYQSCAIDKPYLIVDCTEMDKKEMYTAISRSKRLSDVHFFNTVKNTYVNRKYTHKIYNIERQEKNIQGVIYRIKNNKNNFVYIGRTEVNKNESPEQAMKKRFMQHKKDSESKTWDFYKAIREIGFQNFSIEIVHTGYFSTKRELHDTEQRFISYEEFSYNENGKRKEVEAKPEKFLLEKIIIDKYAPKLSEQGERIVVIYYENGTRKLKKFRFTSKNKNEISIKANEFMKSL